MPSRPRATGPRPTACATLRLTSKRGQPPLEEGKHLCFETAFAESIRQEPSRTLPIEPAANRATGATVSVVPMHPVAALLLASLPSWNL